MVFIAAQLEATTSQCAVWPYQEDDHSSRYVLVIGVGHREASIIQLCTLWGVVPLLVHGCLSNCALASGVSLRCAMALIGALG